MVRGRSKLSSVLNNVKTQLDDGIESLAKQMRGAELSEEGDMYDEIDMEHFKENLLNH